MAALDAYLVLGSHFDQSFAGFDAAVPASGLPQLQLARVGDVATDYGDYFLAGLVGAIIAAERGPQVAAAVAMLPIAEAWNQLFLVTDSLPNTTPPALVLIGVGDLAAKYRKRVTPRMRVVGRRVVVLAVVVLQLGFVVARVLVRPQAVRVPDVPRVEHVARRHRPGRR